jgi:hypothetical protein
MGGSASRRDQGAEPRVSYDGSAFKRRRVRLTSTIAVSAVHRTDLRGQYAQPYSGRCRTSMSSNSSCCAFSFLTGDRSEAEHTKWVGSQRHPHHIRDAHWHRRRSGPSLPTIAPKPNCRAITSRPCSPISSTSTTGSIGPPRSTRLRHTKSPTSQTPTLSVCD